MDYFAISLERERLGVYATWNGYFAISLEVQAAPKWPFSVGGAIALRLKSRA